jgi:hypothetical protein
MADITYFFSYAREDSETALKLAKDLRSVGASLWVDQLDILGGRRWDRAVEEALQACHGMLAVLSPESVGSTNVMDEVSYALEEGKLVVPILLRSCTIPFRLRRVQYIDFTVSYGAGFDQLLKALGIVSRQEAEAPPRHLSTNAPGSAPVVPRMLLDHGAHPRELETEPSTPQSRNKTLGATDVTDDGEGSAQLNNPSGSELTVSRSRTQNWRRVIIESVGRERLRFQIDGHDQEPLIHSIQIALVDRLLDRCIRNTSNDSGTAEKLFELLVPRSLKPALFGEQGTVLVLDVGSARFPWELLQDRDDLPFSLQKGVIRQIAADSTMHYPRGGSGRALVIGDPISGHTFPPLPGAQEEARRVAGLLRASHFEVNLQVHCTVEDTIGALFSGPYQILHLTGNGVVDHEPSINTASSDVKTGGKKVTGFVMGENEYFTSVEAAQMREVAEFVFLNCCHLGQLSDSVSGTSEPNRFAASLSNQFLSMGANAVVAAGWAIEDAAAIAFASELYSAMLAGVSFGNAVYTARRKTFKDYPDTNTWGSYQCYGDPAFKFGEG